MQDKLLVGLIVSILFLICKFIDSRASTKDVNKSPQTLAKDSAFVFVSSLCSLYLIEYFGLLSSDITKKPTGAFTDDPNF